MITKIMCSLTGHAWDYLWNRGVRICRMCEKMEKLNTDKKDV